VIGCSPDTVVFMGVKLPMGPVGFDDLSFPGALVQMVGTGSITMPVVVGRCAGAFLLIDHCSSPSADGSGWVWGMGRLHGTAHPTRIATRPSPCILLFVICKYLSCSDWICNRGAHVSFEPIAGSADGQNSSMSTERYSGNTLRRLVCDVSKTCSISVD
jgi:hypothetical protein